MNYKELFIDKSKTLIINTELAIILGDLNCAIVLNQINYWIAKNKENGKNYYDGRYWVYNSYENWRLDNFPFWSVDTVKRTFAKLEKLKIVISGNYNKYAMDKTKWYTIDYDKLQAMIDEYSKMQCATIEQGKMPQSNDANCVDDNGNFSKPIPENTTDTTNRDYHSENTVSSPTELNTDKSAIPLKGLHTSLSDERKAHGKSKDKWVVTKNHIVSVMDKLGYGELADETQSAIEIFRYYYARYRIHTGNPHPRLNDKTMTDTLRNYIMGSDEVSDHDVDTYEMLIDEHFKNNYGMDIDWSIRHFMTEDVRNKLYCRVR